MYNKILVPLDGSKLAEVALPYAAEIAFRFKAELNLFQVVPRIGNAFGDHSAAAYTDEELEPMIASAQNYLEKVGSGVEDLGITTRSKVGVGVAAYEIIQFAQEESFDMVVMSTHGRTGIRRWVLGSVADKVVRGTNRPVALIRAKGSRPDVRKKDVFNKVLVPLDGSKESEAVIPYIEELATNREMEVTLLHVVKARYFDDSYTELKQLESLKESAAKDYLKKVASQLEQKGIAVKVEVKVATNNREAEEIIQLANNTKADLVAMSTHGRSGIGHWAFGSTADRVLGAGNTPLLLVRPR
ncbi:universal stress protein [Chloroflexota bacterium]